MKRFLSILALGLVFLPSCLSELQGDRDEVSGPSNIVLKISTKAQTKGGASDGDVMSNLHIWLVYNNSVERYLSQDDAACTISGSTATATATFNNVPRGACTIYLVANLPEGTSLPKTYAVGNPINEGFLKYVLPEVKNCEPPFGDSTPGMPLSTSVSLSVGAGTNRVSAELVRTCAKLSLTVRNNTTNNTIILKDLILTNKNPNVGYLFEQSDYSIPGTASFGPFKSITHSSGETVSYVIPQGSERTYIQQYMYETATNGAADLGFEIVGGLFPKGTESAQLNGPDGTLADVYFDKTISSLNYINKYGIPVPLKQIRRNQDVKIVVNIHYNPNSGVLFFETSDWDVSDNNNETTFD